MNEEPLTEVEKPFAPACERNQEAILEALQSILRDTDKHILEVGSGTGQHAVYLGERLPAIIWQTSDLIEKHEGIKMWLSEAGLKNVVSPIEYKAGKSKLDATNIDVVFNANIIHIISEILVEKLIEDLGAALKNGARVLFYGPFKYQGEYTSESNADFDLWLKDNDGLSGIRDVEVIKKLMNNQSFVFIDDIQMPANNQLLVFEKITFR